MKLNLYRNNSGNEHVVKDIDFLRTAYGTLRTESSVITPFIRIEGENFSDVNYIYIEEFNRYYYVKNAVAVRNGLWELECRVDVLMSYSSEIFNQRAVIKRQEKLFNLYQADPQWKNYSDPILDEIAFKEDFSTWSYFLTTVGSYEKPATQN